jgi:PAS domain S-box-containing protein
MQLHDERSNSLMTGTGNVNAQTVREAVEAANLGIFSFDAIKGTCHWSDSLKRMVGLPPDQVETFQTFVDRIHPDDKSQAIAAVKRALDPAGNGIYAAEFQMRGGDGGWFWVGVQGKASFRTIKSRRTAVRLIGLVMDVTERRRMLDHKDMLIREVNHRVKNALLTVTTLLDLQRRMEQDDSVRSRLATAQHRVAAIANLQQHLYKGKTLARVEMSAYLGDLALELVQHLGCGTLTVEVDVQRMDLPSELAVPLGLIVNELITNACKHAFPEGRAGIVKVGLWRREADVLLQVDDDGVGIRRTDMNQEIKIPPGGLGMAVVRSMVTNLEGTLEIAEIHPTGTRISVWFPSSAPAGLPD